MMTLTIWGARLYFTNYRCLFEQINELFHGNHCQHLSIKFPLQHDICYIITKKTKTHKYTRLRTNILKCQKLYRFNEIFLESLETLPNYICHPLVTSSSLRRQNKKLFISDKFSGNNKVGNISLLALIGFFLVFLQYSW